MVYFAYPFLNLNHEIVQMKTQLTLSGNLCVKIALFPSSLYVYGTWLRHESEVGCCGIFSE